MITEGAFWGIKCQYFPLPHPSLDFMNGRCHTNASYHGKIVVLLWRPNGRKSPPVATPLVATTLHSPHFLRPNQSNQRKGRRNRDNDRLLLLAPSLSTCSISRRGQTGGHWWTWTGWTKSGQKNGAEKHNSYQRSNSNRSLSLFLCRFLWYDWLDGSKLLSKYIVFNFSIMLNLILSYSYDSKLEHPVWAPYNNILFLLDHRLGVGASSQGTPPISHENRFGHCRV